MGKNFIENNDFRNEMDKIIAKIKDNLMAGKNQFYKVSELELSQLKDRYYHFEDECKDGYITGSSFVIDKLNLPKGWFHYFLNLKHEINDIAVSAVAHDGAGILSLDSVLFGSITKLSGNENYMHVSQVNRNTRNIWVKNEAGKVYLMNPQPNLYSPDGTLDAENYDFYECKQGAGFIEIKSKRDGLEFHIRIFIPIDLPGEIWTISIKNVSHKTRKINIYPEINFGLDSHPSHYFVGMAVSEVDYDPDNFAIIAKNLDIKNSFPRWGAFISTKKPHSFDSNADTYYGFGASILYPKSVFDEKLANCEAKQPLKGMIGAFQHELFLNPKEHEEFHFAVTSINPEKDVKKQVREWTETLYVQQINHEFDKMSMAWKNIFESYLIKTPSEEIDRTFNIWGKYQSILCSRFNSPYDIGTRDMFQYMLANCMFEPNYVTLMLPYLLNYQYRDGRIPRQICKFSSLHDLRNFMDCQLWMHDLAVLYIKETGDFNILDEQIGFLEDDNKTINNEKTLSVYDHLLLAIKSAYDSNIGDNGLCKLGYGGWNDALDGLRGDKSESVWLSELLVYASRKMMELSILKNDKKTTAYLKKVIEQITDAINTAGWDKNGYYIFGYDNNGKPVGSSANKEGKRHLNENSWAIYSDIIPKERVDEVIDEMKKLKTPFGLRLLSPYSKKSSKEVGRIADQAKGHFENGSVYQHGALFWSIALLRRGYVDEAFENFVLLTNENRVSDISTNPPIYHSNYTAVPDNNDFGKEPYYPFTGSHAWRMRFIAEMIGITPEFDSITINPKIPSVWRKSVADCELIMKARKKSNRLAHDNIFYNIKIYRDDTIKKGMNVIVNGTEMKVGKNGVSISFDDQIFVNKSKKEKDIDISVYI